MWKLVWTNDAPDSLHLALLHQGVDIWNDWRQQNPKIIPSFHKADLIEADLNHANFNKAEFKEANLSGSNLSGASFNEATLTKANLTKANLSGAGFYEADLTEVDLANANLDCTCFNKVDFNGSKFTNATFHVIRISDTNCSQCDFSGASFHAGEIMRTNLNKTNFSNTVFDRTLFLGARLHGANFSGATLNNVKMPGAYLNGAKFNNANLAGIDLSGADLSNVDLSSADLSDANLSDANLSNANFHKAILSRACLTRVKAINTDFSGVELTGACIEDWIVNKSNLNNVFCQFVYLKCHKEERRPLDRNFEESEFTRLYQVAQDTIELVFRNGINWQAFAFAFTEANANIYDLSGYELYLKKYESLGDGFIRLEVIVPSGLDHEDIQRDLVIRYERQIAKLEGKVEVQSEFIRSLQDENKQLLRTLALVPINYHFHRSVHLQTGTGSNMTNNNGEGDTYNVEQAGAVGRYARSDYNTFIHSWEKQTLAESIEEILHLIKQLEENNPSANESDQITYINDETTPSFKRRVAGALQACGETALDEFVLENKYLKLVKAVIKGWLQPGG
ncbi:pentapeptide repeat-containing protein [Pantanalinema sp. GBBB05]|uniref:pentapeptide repeat-containing protein n=1 Tax=Pantanalinema sp. GBBB05 TaxID=2604139 RepID=UPI001DEBBC35|nr:pentapeptide repeat-containing protein [Pantanalinema sp. GBBB05]